MERRRGRAPPRGAAGHVLSTHAPLRTRAAATLVTELEIDFLAHAGREQRALEQTRDRHRTDPARHRCDCARDRDRLVEGDVADELGLARPLFWGVDAIDADVDDDCAA